MKISNMKICDIKEGMTVSTYICGMCCHIINVNNDLLMIDSSSGETVGTVKDNLEYIESII